MPHTPGPWNANCFLVTASNGREVTHTGLLGRRKSSHDGQSGGDEDAVNARLIAASPDMLDACERTAKELTTLVDHWDEFSASRIRHELNDIVSELLKPSIAKAKGGAS